jgi:predicted transcriptional regulator
LVVGDQGDVVGVLGHADAVAALARLDAALPVASAMRTSFDKASPDERVDEVFERMRAKGSGPVVVVQEGRMVGLLTPESVHELVAMRLAVRGKPATA